MEVHPLVFRLNHNSGPGCGVAAEWSCRWQQIGVAVGDRLGGKAADWEVRTMDWLVVFVIRRPLDGRRGKPGTMGPALDAAMPQKRAAVGSRLVVAVGDRMGGKAADWEVNVPRIKYESSFGKNSEPRSIVRKIFGMVGCGIAPALEPVQ